MGIRYNVIRVYPVFLFNLSKCEICLLLEISFLTYSVGAVAYAVLHYLAAAIKLPQRKNSMISLFICVI